MPDIAEEKTVIKTWWQVIRDVLKWNQLQGSNLWKVVLLEDDSKVPDFSLLCDFGQVSAGSPRTPGEPYCYLQRRTLLIL